MVRTCRFNDVDRVRMRTNAHQSCRGVQWPGHDPLGGPNQNHARDRRIVLIPFRVAMSLNSYCCLHSTSSSIQLRKCVATSPNSSSMSTQALGMCHRQFHPHTLNSLRRLGCPRPPAT